MTLTFHWLRHLWAGIGLIRGGIEELVPARPHLEESHFFGEGAPSTSRTSAPFAAVAS